MTALHRSEAVNVSHRLHKVQSAFADRSYDGLGRNRRAAEALRYVARSQACSGILLCALPTSTVMAAAVAVDNRFRLLVFFSRQVPNRHYGRSAIARGTPLFVPSGAQVMKLKDALFVGRSVPAQGSRRSYLRPDSECLAV